MTMMIPLIPLLVLLVADHRKTASANRKRAARTVKGFGGLAHFPGQPLLRAAASGSSLGSVMSVGGGLPADQGEVRTSYSQHAPFLFSIATLSNPHHASQYCPLCHCGSMLRWWESKAAEMATVFGAVSAFFVEISWLLTIPCAGLECLWRVVIESTHITFLFSIHHHEALTPRSEISLERL